MILVSIIIPMFNAEKTIEKCLDSCISQTYKDIEIVVINDGSTDASLKIVNEYLKKDSRIVVHSQKNGGSASATNAGLKLAKGDYIQFLDSDDWLHERAVQTTVEQALEHPEASFILYGFNIFSNDKLLRTPNPGNSIYKANDDYERFKNVEPLMPSRCNKLYKRSYIVEYSPENMVYAEDLVFNYKNFDSKTTIVAIEDCLYNVQLATENSVNKRYKKNKLLDSIYASEICDNKLVEVFSSQIDNNKLKKKSINMVSSIIFVVAGKADYKEYIGEMEKAYSQQYFLELIKSKVDAKIYYRIIMFLTRHKLMLLLRLYCKTLSLLR